jgi:NAD(P) transhydrogenase subunit alpha
MENLLILIMIFALALFLGYELITKIPPTLHTPLMSGSNAISGIVIIGSIIILKNGDGRIMEIIGFGALILSTINVVGGFLVTDRMLSMFKKTENNHKK